MSVSFRMPNVGKGKVNGLLLAQQRCSSARQPTQQTIKNSLRSQSTSAVAGTSLRGALRRPLLCRGEKARTSVFPCEPHAMRYFAQSKTTKKKQRTQADSAKPLSSCALLFPFRPSSRPSGGRWTFELPVLLRLSRQASDHPSHLQKGSRTLAIPQIGTVSPSSFFKLLDYNTSFHLCQYFCHQNMIKILRFFMNFYNSSPRLVISLPQARILLPITPDFPCFFASPPTRFSTPPDPLISPLFPLLPKTRDSRVHK